MFENIETHQNPIVFVWLGNRGDLGFQNVMVSMNVFFLENTGDWGCMPIFKHSGRIS